MKKLLVSLMCVCMCLVGCSKQDNSKIQLGVLQLMDHEALNSTYEGFLDALKEAGYEDKVNMDIHFQNPNDDKTIMATMAETLVNQNNDLILAIGTNAAIALQTETDTIPIIGSAITDYVEAGLATSNEAPGANITGASDACDMVLQMDLLQKVAPEAKKVGILYTSSETNSEIQAKQAKAECENRNLEVVIKTVSDKTMIDDTMQALVNEVDVIYIPTDNNIASAMASVEIVATENKVPVVVGCDTMCADGGLVSVGVNYYNLGYETGKMAVKILEGASPATMPIYFSEVDAATIYYNSQVAAKMGITLSSEILEKGVDMAPTNE